MPTTPNYSIPYPALSDSPNGPSQLQSLATVTDTALQGLQTSITSLTAKVTPVCSVTRATTQSIANSAFTNPISWSGVVNSRNGGVWDSANPTRLTVPVGAGGLYSAMAGCAFAANGTGARGIYFQKNGTTLLRGMNLPNSGASLFTELFLDREIDLVAGDYLEVIPWQNSGGALNIVAQDGVPFCVFRRVQD
jgi:hypothetical protein